MNIYGKQDLIRDLPMILGDSRIDTVIEHPDRFVIVTTDLYGNYYTKESEAIGSLITIRKCDGKCIKISRLAPYESDEADEINGVTFECTAEDIDINDLKVHTIDIPKEYLSYDKRLTDELLRDSDSYMTDIMRHTKMLESTYFEDIDYDTMKSVAIMYLNEKSLGELEELSLEEKVQRASKYKKEN